jgi:hypothetical protein
VHTVTYHIHFTMRHNNSRYFCSGVLSRVYNHYSSYCCCVCFLTSLTKLIKPSSSTARPYVLSDRLFGYLLRNKKVVNYEVTFIKCISENALSAFNTQFLCKRLMITVTGIETCSWMIWNIVDSCVWTGGWAFYIWATVKITTRWQK